MLRIQPCGAAHRADREARHAERGVQIFTAFFVGGNADGVLRHTGHILPQRQIQCRQRIGHVQVHAQQAGHLRAEMFIHQRLQNLISRDAQQLLQHPIGHLKAGNHMMASAFHETTLRRVFVRVEIAFHQIAVWRAVGEILHNVPAGGVSAERDHILAGGLCGVVNEIQNHPVMDGNLVDAQQLAVARGALSSRLDFIIMRIHLLHELECLLDFTEAKHRRAR